LEFLDLDYQDLLFFHCTLIVQTPIVQPVGARVRRPHVLRGVTAETQRNKHLAILAMYDVIANPHKFAVGQILRCSPDDCKKVLGTLSAEDASFLRTNNTRTL